MQGNALRSVIEVSVLCSHSAAVRTSPGNFVSSAEIPSKAFCRGSTFRPFNKRDEYS